MSAADHVARAEALLGQWGLAGGAIVPVEVGLINLTYRVEVEGTRYALQRLNPIFGARVHDDIHAVTRHLAQKGLRTPHLVDTVSGAKWVEDGGEVWRVMTWVDGVTYDRLDGPLRAAEAGRLLGRFHAAVQDLEHEFQNRRLGVHDTPKHLRALSEALVSHADHPRYAQIAPLGRAILGAADALGAMPPMADRVVHGDPKISNVVFERSAGRAICLIDLDTLARMPVCLELGDAFRSWCNPSGEDSAEVEFSMPMFEAAVSGWAETAGAMATSDERNNIVRATGTIIVELAARFCADALVERYFGWDPKRFATRGEHNELRARGQLSLARSLATQEAAAERAVRDAF